MDRKKKKLPIVPPTVNILMCAYYILATFSKWQYVYNVLYHTFLNIIFFLPNGLIKQ